MKLCSQVLALGLSGAIVAALVNAVGLFSVSRLVAPFDVSVEMASAAQNSQRAAMLSGTIGGEVQRAMLGSIGRDKAQVGEAELALQTHVAEMLDALADLRELPLSPEALSTVQATTPMAMEYVGAASELLNLIAGDSPAASAAAAPRVQKIYAQIEQQMSKQVWVIGRHEESFRDGVLKEVKDAQFSIGIALAIAAVALTLASLEFARRIARPMNLAVQVSRALARGNLGAEVQPCNNDETRGLLKAMKEMQLNILIMVTGVQRSAREVAMASAQFSHASIDLSARSSQQATSLQQTAASMKMLNATVSQNDLRTKQADELASSACSLAAKGGEIATRVVETMCSIHQDSIRITEIVALVNNLARQTNILALNASLEASRAGEAGRDFAIVAGEVRSRAERSAEAADGVAGLVHEAAGKVQKRNELSGEAGGAMINIVEEIRRGASIVGEILTASRKQSTGISSVASAMAAVDHTTQQNVPVVQEMSAAAGGLK